MASGHLIRITCAISTVRILQRLAREVELLQSELAITLEACLLYFLDIQVDRGLFLGVCWIKRISKDLDLRVERWADAACDCRRSVTHLCIGVKGIAKRVYADEGINTDAN